MNNNTKVFSLNSLLEENEIFIEEFKKSAIMQLINGDMIEKKEIRMNMLDCIQAFSNHFQNAVMLRQITTEHAQAAIASSKHLQDEFMHNEMLLRDRKYRPPAWDPILESTSCWFTWKMLTLDNIEKTALMHLVLETSADIFFTAAHKVMQRYKETTYFSIHAQVDDHHAAMGNQLLENLSPSEYQRLYTVLKQGWMILIAASNRIAALSVVTNKVGVGDTTENLAVT